MSWFQRLRGWRPVGLVALVVAYGLLGFPGFEEPEERVAAAQSDCGPYGAWPSGKCRACPAGEHTHGSGCHSTGIDHDTPTTTAAPTTTAVPGDQVGPLRWRAPSRWEAVVDEVFDMCDDVEALAAITGRRLGPGDFISSLGRDRIDSWRLRWGVSCDPASPGAKRYSLVHQGGPGTPAATLAAAVEAVPQSWRGPSPNPGFWMGYSDPFDDYFVESPTDEVVVLAESVLVSGGVLRGLVQNMSAGMFARGLTVSVGDSVWSWPLTVQPGEVAPFAIDGYQAPADPAAVTFAVSASLTPTPDPSRSFLLENVPGNFEGTWNEYLNYFPPFAADEPPQGETIHFYETIVSVRAPTSHPSIAAQIRETGLTIEDFKAYYVALNPQGRVLEIRRLAPYLWQRMSPYGENTQWEWVTVTRIPHINPHLPEVGPTYEASVGFVTTERGLLIIGGAETPATNSGAG